jgi:hypothetical protein
MNLLPKSLTRTYRVEGDVKPLLINNVMESFNNQKHYMIHQSNI